MTADEVLLSANRKWLAARGVTDWQTMRRAVKAAQKKAMRKFDAFVAAFDELEMLSSLCPDGSEITFNAGTERERRQIRKMAWMIGNYIKGSCE